MSAAREGGSDDRAAPLPLPERRRLRSIGVISGGLVGVGVAVLLPGLLFAAIFVAFATSGFGGTAADDPMGWWVLLLIALGVALVAAGWLVSVRRLRRWGHLRALRVTAVATSLAGIAAVLADLAIVGLFVVLETAQIAPSEWALVPVAGVLGIAAGALIGGAVWPAVGRRLQPPVLRDRA